MCVYDNRQIDMCVIEPVSDAGVAAVECVTAEIGPAINALLDVDLNMSYDSEVFNAFEVTPEKGSGVSGRVIKDVGVVKKALALTNLYEEQPCDTGIMSIAYVTVCAGV